MMNGVTLRRALLPLLLAVSLAAVIAYFVGATVRIALLGGGDDKNLLSVIPRGIAAGQAALSNVPGIADDPLSQHSVNAVIAARARATGDIDRALQELKLLRNLGWRDVGARQNLLWKASLTRDLPLMMDTFDALLRREILLDQIYPVLNLMTTDESFQKLLIPRLAGRPPWRLYYFLSASNLSDPSEIEGRYQVMRSLQQRGDRLTRNEIAPLLPKLMGADRTANALDLWHAHRGVPKGLLTDPNFARAALSLPEDALPIPFEWQLRSGSGYFADAGRDGQGSFMNIEWNGRGMPVFASQVISGRAGRYRLSIEGEPPLSKAASRIGFRLLCPEGRKVGFVPTAGRLERSMKLVGDGRVACDFPEFQVVGLAQAGTNAVSLVFRMIQLEWLE